MFCKNFDYDPANTKDGKLYGVGEIYASSAPSSFPVDGTGMGGRFPAAPEKCVFLPGSTLYATGSGQLWILNPDGNWDAQ